MNHASSRTSLLSVRFMTAASTLVLLALVGGAGCATAVDDDDMLDEALLDDDGEVATTEQAAVTACGAICAGGGAKAAARARICAPVGLGAGVVVCGVGGYLACEGLCSGRRTGTPRRLCTSSRNNTRKCALWGPGKTMTEPRCHGYYCT